MRNDDLPRICGAIEQHVADAFEMLELTADRVGERYACLPYLDELYEPGCETLPLRQMVCRALAARQWSREPPELPLSSAEIKKMIRSKNNRHVLVGYFAASLAADDWHHQDHPSFQDFCCGVMASPYCPDRIRNDPELRKEFPPRELRGLDESLIWGLSDRTHELIQLLMRSEKLLRHSGKLRNAAWMREAIIKFTGVRLNKPLRDFLDNPPGEKPFGILPSGYFWPS